KHLDATLAEVVKVAGYPDFAGRVYILSDPNRLMAHASAEGNIFITLNFLQNVQSQAELSNLIAHEFAHIALGHHDSDMVKNINARVVTAMNGMAKVSAVATSLSEKSQTRLPGNIQSSIEVIEKARFVQDLVAQVISPSWGRQQELEADQLAADISVRLGNSLDESYTWLIRLGKLHDAGNYDKIQVNRVNMRYIEGMQQSLEKAKADSAGLGDMAEGAIATLAYGAVIKAIEYFAQSHSDPNHRKSMLRVYQKNLYLDEEPKDGPAVDEWRKVKGDAEFRDTLKAYLLADEALAQSRKPETRRLAEKTMMQAERLRPKGHVYIWERKVAMYDTLN
ncbi:MAG: M48 family metalloprotease, partial [Gammaproteobacteria bacterium]